MVTIKFEFTENILNEIMKDIKNNYYGFVIIAIVFCFPLCFSLDISLALLEFVFTKKFDRDNNAI